MITVLIKCGQIQIDTIINNKQIQSISKNYGETKYQLYILSSEVKSNDFEISGEVNTPFTLAETERQHEITICQYKMNCTYVRNKRNLQIILELRTSAQERRREINRNWNLKHFATPSFLKFTSAAKVYFHLFSGKV